MGLQGRSLRDGHRPSKPALRDGGESGRLWGRGGTRPYQIGGRLSGGFTFLLGRRLPTWKSAIGSLAPAPSVLRTFAPLGGANPFRRFPNGSSQQVWKPAIRGGGETRPYRVAERVGCLFDGGCFPEYLAGNSTMIANTVAKPASAPAFRVGDERLDQADSERREESGLAPH